MNRFLSVQDIASMFGAAQGLPLNRHVKPAMQISDEALRATAARDTSDPTVGARLSTLSPRSTVGEGLGAALAAQFPSNVHGDRAQARAQKQVFRNQT
jgi:hypothetical protein